MRMAEIMAMLYNKAEEIKDSLPDLGRRFEVTGYVVTQGIWDSLMEDKDFADSFYKGRPNLGGIVVQIGDQVEIKFIQYKKGQKWFGDKR